jgi:oligopeptidase B
MDYLIAANMTNPSKLVISGGSAGGLLIGAVLNLAPNKMKLVLADVPFVDPINTMLDPDLPLTTQNYEEWGNPNQREVFEYICYLTALMTMFRGQITPRS